MVEIDYIFEADALRYECQHQNLISDYTLAEREMLVRLRISGVEVLGHTEEEYLGWMAALKRNKSSLHVPSSAWSLLAVLSIAVSIDDALYHLQQEGRGDIDAIDREIRMTQQNGIVTVYMRPNRAGYAPFVEVDAALTSFTGRVRRDFLSICPQLRDHVTLGAWFKGEQRSSVTGESQDILPLPPTSVLTTDHAASEGDV